MTNKVKNKKPSDDNRYSFVNLVDKVPMALTFIPVLKFLASRNETLTYSEFGDLFGIHHRSLPSYLRILDIYCATHKLPHINYLVVHQRSMVSGDINDPHTPTFHDQLDEQDTIFNRNWTEDLVPSENTMYKDMLKVM
jgi:hypothetical protein